MEHTSSLIIRICFIQLILPLSIVFTFGCSQNKSIEIKQYNQTTEALDYTIDKSDSTVLQRFPAPNGYQRIGITENSFGSYLRNLPLKEKGALVSLYDGRIKPNSNIYEAVVDLDIGNKNLHQCADAIIRLKADYHWKNGEHNSIQFNLTNGFKVDYSSWVQGNRVQVEGNKTSWIKSHPVDSTYQTYWDYLEFIFTYAGTLSLSKELNEASIEDIKIGDVFIQGGSPGHAVIVVDMAINKITSEKLFMLAQSYMPAQEIQILISPFEGISPWYQVQNHPISTPEWTFYPQDLKRF